MRVVKPHEPWKRKLLPWLMIGFFVGLAVIFPRVAAFAEGAALNLRRFWWIILILILVWWSKKTFDARN